MAGSDAGFVHLGDPVTIKFDTFPFTQYGSASGTVRVISPDSFSTPNMGDSVSHGTPQPGQPAQRRHRRVRLAQHPTAATSP